MQPADHVVVQETHFYALGHLLQQEVPYFPPCRVIAKSEILDVDRGAGPPDIFQQQFPFPVSPGDDFKRIAFGKPVVATRVGGIPDMVRDGETGLLIPPNDPDALREALGRLMSDPVLRTALGTSGKTFAATALSWESIAEKHCAFYQRFIS